MELIDTNDSRVIFNKGNGAFLPVFRVPADVANGQTFGICSHKSKRIIVMKQVRALKCGGSLYRSVAGSVVEINAISY